MSVTHTLNELDTNTKSEAVALLQARLVDSIDLALTIKQAHWNLHGAAFIAVHEMLDKLRDDVDDYVDTMAERARALGGTPVGTVQTVAEKTVLAPYPTDIHSIEDHLRALAQRVAAVTNAVRDNIDDADEAGDANTADVFTEVSRGLDKWLWMIESHLPA
jgi:starvation-inducible DNA-binding protein